MSAYTHEDVSVSVHVGIFMSSFTRTNTDTLVLGECSLFLLLNTPTTHYSRHLTTAAFFADGVTRFIRPGSWRARVHVQQLPQQFPARRSKTSSNTQYRHAARAESVLSGLCRALFTKLDKVPNPKT